MGACVGVGEDVGVDVGVDVDVGVGVDVGIAIVDETPPRSGVLAPKKLTTPVEAAAALGFAIDAVEPLKLNVSDLAALNKLPDSEAVVGAAAAAAAGMVTVDSETQNTAIAASFQPSPKPELKLKPMDLASFFRVAVAAMEVDSVVF